MIHAAMKISVVIPTTGRKSLARAVASVFAQEGAPPVQVIVVPDGPDARRAVAPGLAARPDLVVLNVVERIGGAACRNLGVQAADGELVAFLDDDDEWLPTKLRDQVAEFVSHAEAASEPIIGCFSVQRAESSEIDSRPVPARAPQQGQPLQDYLFLKRGIQVGRASLFTSTLLLSRQLAARVPWDPSLERHQDWDWLLRLQDAGSHVYLANCVGARIFVNSSASISASSNWQRSLRWVDDHGSNWNPITKADFIAGQPLRYALQARDLKGVGTVLARLLRSGRMPHIQTVMLGLAGIAGRQHLPALLQRSGRVQARQSSRSSRLVSDSQQ
ncbi:glycosyltransferase [Microbacterium horticulturae]|uniref:Glycosyltransferase n=1 Tax=Microbacterium horticulturae TaxID=3028316 RepID=A0ABY8BVH3_9MICO|nr:glycosyltransferase [Microbacterium sp. KACC 23027]WEG08166.1 glycosyltransferase [Microbacterium sp. KACC 23027]